MQSRKMILTVLVGGPVLGTLLGLATNTTMLAPPEPAWRSAEPDPIFVESQRLADSEPQRVAASWRADSLVDRTPTWRRGAEMRQMAAYVPETAPVAVVPPADSEPAAETAPTVRLDEAAGPPADTAAEAAAASDEAPGAVDAPAISLEPAPAGA